MSIAKVWITEGCIVCGLCESISPEVFVIEDEAKVKDGVDFSSFENEIREAADGCPTQVIKYEEG